MSDWKLKKYDPIFTKNLSAELGIHPITAIILANRGVTTTAEGLIFMAPKLAHLADPFGLQDMKLATERIVLAVKKREKIAIFGDYDTDGITSTALLYSFFRECGVETITYIPNRLTDGYGLSANGIEKLNRDGARLIITVDNGINSHVEIDHAKKLGIDVIVTDHHELPQILPNAIANINPKRNESNFSGLAGVGVAFYLAMALRSAFRDTGLLINGEPDLKNYLDLVALGTIADVAPLTKTNRTLVRFGLKMLPKSVRPGIIALGDAAGTDLNTIDSFGVAFRLAPRINAAGRLGDQDLSLKLLTTMDRAEAKEIALKLNKMNAQRQTIEKKMLEDIHILNNASKESASGIVIWSDEWHRGIIGIAASKLVDLHSKPAALICVNGDVGRGSVRSVGSFNIMKTMEHCSKYLLNFGGHPAAAGFDIETSKLQAFKDAFNEHLSQNLSGSDRCATLSLEASVNASDINIKLLDELAALSPFGEGNPEPLLRVSQCSITETKIVGNNHLKLKLKDRKISLDAIGFNLGEKETKIGKEYIFAGTPQINEWNGKRLVQLKLKDIKPS